MRNFKDAKLMAKALRSAMETRGVHLTHSETLEIVATQFGFENWNVFSARIDPLPDPDGISFTGTAPVLRSFDEAKAKEFYIDYLGFTLDWEHRFEPGMPLYFQVSRSGLTLHISEHHGDATPGATVFVTMTGIEDYHRELHAKSYANLRPGIQNQPWGREMTLTDPFQNRLRLDERPR
ncbi:VOC family protein [Rhodospirillaceae bacterium KN72]|uniref:Bleomycin resistance protein n=1 Tax=Pacificispira spongiicola TaxID=2729598 RepID=A0A7Y0HGI0_9PROT|nr:glyoxalase superfamily protein [Pacificispira spongiicola]NMM44379.1 VOC family protein [Pacificispira spongiicola]